MSKIKKISPFALNEVAGLFKALSEPLRLQIIQNLGKKPMSVGELVSRLKQGQANISKHLKVLYQAGLVTNTKKGVSVIYEISDRCIEDICNVVCKGYFKIMDKKNKLIGGGQK